MVEEPNATASPPRNMDWTPISGIPTRFSLASDELPKRVTILGFAGVDSEGVPEEKEGSPITTCFPERTDGDCRVTKAGGGVAIQVLRLMTPACYIVVNAAWAVGADDQRTASWGWRTESCSIAVTP